MYLDTPIVLAIQRKYPRVCRWAPTAGLLGMCLSLIASSFSQTTTHLIVTQGVMYAVAGSICYCPCILYLDEWFARRKGFAYGVMWSGTGLGGFALPLVLEALLGRFEFRNTLRIWAGCLFVLTAPLVAFIKPRVPLRKGNPAASAAAAAARQVHIEDSREAGVNGDLPQVTGVRLPGSKEETTLVQAESHSASESASQSTAPAARAENQIGMTVGAAHPNILQSALDKFGIGFVLQRDFAIYQLASIIESVGFFLPTLYLPSFSREVLRTSVSASALPVIFTNVASVLGLVAVGALSDRMHVTTCIGVSTVGAVLGTFFLWGFAATRATLYGFCFVYGVFAGSYVAAWPRIMDAVVGEAGEPGTAAGGGGDGGGSTCSRNKNTKYDRLMVFGLLAAGRGLGNVMAGPLSELLVREHLWEGKAAGAYGSGYGMLIVFTGATAMIGGAPWVCRRVFRMSCM